MRRENKTDMTDTAIVIAKADDIPDDDVVAVSVQGHALAVYKVDGHVYASDDLCNHGNARLSDGFVEDGLIECPLHGGAFDIKTGAAKRAPVTECMKTYAVEVRGGDVVLLDPAQLPGQS